MTTINIPPPNTSNSKIESTVDIDISLTTNVKTINQKKGNIIQFPKDKIVRQIPNLEEYKADIENRKKEIADMLLAEYASNIWNSLISEPIHLENKRFFNDFCFVIEALKAGLYRSLEIPHPLQEYIDTNFIVNTDESQNQKEEEEEEIIKEQNDVNENEVLVSAMENASDLPSSIEDSSYKRKLPKNRKKIDDPPIKNDEGN